MLKKLQEKSNLPIDIQQKPKEPTTNVISRSSKHPLDVDSNF